MNLKEKYRVFKEWQQRPYQVAPLTQEEHTCATCGTSYQGNYCPRCGQSSRIGRYSMKTAFLLFLDVWGLGNRGMFRSIRDLLLRPGYMIRDYLGGMHMAYFPPFKMFFLLATLSILVNSGLNIRGENQLVKVVQTYERSIDMDIRTVPAEQKAGVKSGTDNERLDFGEKINGTLKVFIRFLIDHQTVVELVWLLVLSLPLYVLFRNCPAIPDLYYTEFFVAMIYITNMMNIVSIVFSFFCVNLDTIGFISPILSIVALKQLCGYSYLRTILGLVASFAIITIAVLIIVVLVGIVVGLTMAMNAQ
ncbi:Protein of unknown function [Prevotella communis]|uniref:DUF3667 domain-containing protein n=1 Tax=Prevotella communis TaxID=2913614 RepID=A0A1G7WWU0_9BACT|nr:DUF3667 domain-containing protein [Prevotella communis]SDG76374.1 Protein of unknown function [Prevotella communis]